MARRDGQVLPEDPRETVPGLFEDVRDVGRHNLRLCDVLVGGFPCQDLSVAGKRAGLSGERSGLFWEFVRLARELRPTWLVIENVPGLLSSNGAAVRFLSLEPLLGKIILHKHLAQCGCGHGHGFTACPNTGGVAKTCHRCDCMNVNPKIHWVIVGCESGPKHRPCPWEWMESIVGQCRDAGVPVFVKQLAANSNGEGAIYKHKPGDAWPSWVPSWARVQEFPK